MLLCIHHATCNLYSFLTSCNAEVKSVERHLHALMCSVSVVTVVFIRTMEDDQRLNTLVHEGDILHFSPQHCKRTKTTIKAKIWSRAKSFCSTIKAVKTEEA